MLLRQSEHDDRRKTERLPCHLKLEINAARGVTTMPVYEISMDGILIGGADAAKLRCTQASSTALSKMSAPAAFA